MSLLSADSAPWTGRKLPCSGAKAAQRSSKMMEWSIARGGAGIDGKKLVVYNKKIQLENISQYLPPDTKWNSSSTDVNSKPPIDFRHLDVHLPNIQFAVKCAYEWDSIPWGWGSPVRHPDDAAFCYCDTHFLNAFYYCWRSSKYFDKSQNRITES